MTAKGRIMVEVGAGEHQQASQDSEESAQVELYIICLHDV